MLSDVLIIGGGVIGLSIARELHRAGVRGVTIIEKGVVGREASYAAAGMLAPNAETDKLDDFYRFCVDSIGLYPSFAERLLDETGIDIELDRSGTLYLAFSETDEAELNERFEWQRSAGIEAERLTVAEILDIEPALSPDARSGIFYPNDWQVENRKLLAALTKYAELNGVEIVTGTDVSSLIIEDGKIAGAEATGEKYFADTTILATGAWTSLIKLGETFVPVEVKPVRGQMISFRPAGRMFEKVIYSPRGYIVPRRDGRILAGATVEDVGFDRSVTQSGLDVLRQTALEIAPRLANLEVDEQWAGLRPYAKDGLPVIGEFAGLEDLIIATAHYRNGILLAPLTAKIIAEKVAANVGSDYLKVFGPERLRSERTTSAG